MKILIIISMMLLCSVEVYSQYNFNGTIADQNNQPVEATIYLPQLEKGTISNFDGTFSINNIASGTYTVIFSALGYATISKKLIFNADVSENITLSESAVEMEEVILSTPFHKLQSDNVMKVERVSVNELKANGTTTLAEGITQIAGVASISTGVGIGKPVIRGLSSNRVLVYTQGVRLENQQFGGEHGLGVNEAGIESVEVIKGPASLLYGSDALGGVLYLNPENFANSGEIHSDIESTYFSNTLGTASTVGVKISEERFKFLVRGAYSAHSDYNTGADYRVTNSRFNEKDLKTGVRFQNNLLKSTLRYNYNRSNIGIPEEIEAQNTSKSLLNPFQEIDNHILSFDNTIFLNHSSFQLKAGYIFNDRREFEENASAEEGAALQLKLNTFNYDLKYNLPILGNFETIMGIQGLFQNNKNLGAEILIPDATTTDFGIFATTHYHLEKVDLQAGLRFDNRKIESKSYETEGEIVESLNRKFNSSSVALGAKFDFTEKFIGRINLATGFRSPNLAELTSNGVHEGTNRFEIGNPDLINEQNFQTDLALEFRNEHFEFFANIFYNYITNYIFINPTGEIILNNDVYKYEQDNASLYGGELGLHIHPHPLDWLHYESSFESVTGKISSGDFLPLIPANKIVNTLRIEFSEMIKLKDLYAFLRFENYFAKKNVGSFEIPSGGYNLLSTGLGSSFHIRKLKLNAGISVTNLTNESYISHLSRLKTDGIFNPGRGINFNLKMSI